jgi:hypothetical protein
MNVPGDDDTLATEHIYMIPQLPQAQYSLEEQIAEMRHAAIRLGLVDAADWVKARNV